MFYNKVYTTKSHLIYLKADMNSDLTLQTATKFFYRTFFSNSEYWLCYVMVDFICNGLLQLQGTRVKRELQNEKILPTVEFEPGIFRFRSDHANHYTTKSDTLSSVLKVYQLVPVLLLEIYL